MTNPVRRIVTGNDAEGRSSIVEDGLPPAVITVPERPGYVVSNVWTTAETPADIDRPDASTAHRGILPPGNGTILRVIEYPPEPETREEFEAMARATFRALYPDVAHNPDAATHAGMHTTETVDYAIILDGEITAVMDDGETVMKAGDILIQRGTNHAWANRSGKPCRIAFVLIDGCFA
jgi:mannose-6-phosphate isomerase-like protein (cupin superfamily)